MTLMKKFIVLPFFMLFIFCGCQSKKEQKPITLPKIFESCKYIEKIDKNTLSEFEASGEVILLKHFLQPHFIVFDVGANVGKWSQLVLSYEPSCKITAFEPVPEVFQKLKNNKILKKRKTSFHNYALSNESGKDIFYYYNKSNELSLLSSFYNRPSVNQDQATQPLKISIEKETLDHFCFVHKIPYIDFLKIDTEGAELAVLKGAKNLIENHQITAIQFEYGKAFLDAHASLEEIFSLLTKNDYLIFRMESNGLVFLPKWNPLLENYQFSNFFTIYRKKLPDFKK